MSVSVHPSRRDCLTHLPAAAVGGALASTAAAADKRPDDPFIYGLNTSTISRQKKSLSEEIDIAAKAGYGAIEPWVHELDAHVKQGGKLKDIAKRARDSGLVVADVIAFFEWIVDDDERRKKGMEEAKRLMDLAQQIGSVRIAAPPAGATKQTGLDLRRAAERYRALLEIGDKIGVVPQVEVWGFSTTLGRLGEATLVAMEASHPKACVLADVFHLYKGGSGFTSLKLLSPAALQMIHVNDYPANPPRAVITDGSRVYPGDGVAPLKELLRDVRAQGCRPVLSLELFNETYWKQDALEVARTGLEKMRAVVRAAGSPRPSGERGRG
jgi:2-keto-myo-inositol isomerase